MDGTWLDERWLRTYRAIVMGTRGAVACGHPLAAQAGLEALRHGAGAADAAVVIASTLAVVEPMMSGLGGDGFFMHYGTRNEQGTVINASGPAPRAAGTNRFADGLPEVGALAGSVPGVIDGWWELNQRFGRWDFGDLLQSAIYYAREGFGASRRYIQLAAEKVALAEDQDAARIFLPGGRVPELGERIVQPDLSRSLQALAKGGAEAFYRGPLGKRFAAAIQAKGGLLGELDLIDYACQVQEPIATEYRGYTVLETPPNSTGFTLLQELNMAERFDLRKMGFLSADSIHTLVEIKKLAFIDRESWCTDPRFLQAPIESLLSKDRARELADQIDPARAMERPIGVPAPRGAETTYFCVMDREGNAVSGIQSINDSFGAATVAGDTGILMNNRMRYWHLDPDHPNSLEPGKRVRHTMNAPMVLKGGQVRVVFGTPGADAQVQTNLQVLTNLIDFDLDPQQAVEAPRWRSYQLGGEANWPHTVSNHLVIEDRVPDATRRELTARGHRLEVVGPLEAGCNAQIILRRSDGLLLAASDPRRDGYAAAY